MAEFFILWPIMIMGSNNGADNIQYDDNFKFQTGIGPMTDKILNSILDRLTSESFKEKVSDKIVGPVTEIINRKIKPYVYTSIGLYGIVILLLLIIIYLLIVRKK